MFCACNSIDAGVQYRDYPKKQLFCQDRVHARTAMFLPRATAMSRFFVYFMSHITPQKVYEDNNAENCRCGLF